VISSAIAESKNGVMGESKQMANMPAISANNKAHRVTAKSKFSRNN